MKHAICDRVQGHITEREHGALPQRGERGLERAAQSLGLVGRTTQPGSDDGLVRVPVLHDPAEPQTPCQYSRWYPQAPRKESRSGASLGWSWRIACTPIETRPGPRR